MLDELNVLYLTAGIAVVKRLGARHFSAAKHVDSAIQALESHDYEELADNMRANRTEAIHLLADELQHGMN
jgi:hypothetical protein